MTMKQLKATAKTMRKSCQPKNNVSDEKIDPINEGVFYEEKEVMCYMACIMKMANAIKNNKLSYDSAVKQVDLLLPEELKEPAKAALAACRKVAEGYKDICEAAFHTTKCIYNFNPDIFFFPYFSVTMKEKETYIIVVATLLTVAILCDGMSVKQMKYMAKLTRMNCQSKTNASDGEIDLIQKGIFSGASKDVKCYIACMMKMAGTLKGSDFNYESAMKQADTMLPDDKKKLMKEALKACKNSSDPYKDPCEAAYHISQCFYNHNPEMFYIPKNRLTMSIYIVIATLLTLALLCDGMTMNQIRAMGKSLRKNCQPKNNVSDEQVDPIGKGVFSGANKDVMCYIACIMKMSGTLKGAKMNYENAIKQADTLLPDDMKEPAKQALTGCKNSGDPYKDPCEAAYHISQCIYNFNPDIFYFP
ncbi:uncharacterized protein LOC121735019 [Aricia agestis]|uniref:uncharacterized protein LOC121735019 n=1 Tax=Aricia agestis TaxID=91739 RepID=UPI001C205271|nr:uncharacterized protein LOC121735019 [Aricia agestis]